MNDEIWFTVHKSGSHNLVIGAKHNYSKYSGLVAGYSNSLLSDCGGDTGHWL